MVSDIWFEYQFSLLNSRNKDKDHISNFHSLSAMSTKDSFTYVMKVAMKKKTVILNCNLNCPKYATCSF